jgi:group I intron endonuclease
MHEKTQVWSLYRIINKVNGKIYIGQAADVAKRWHDHRRAVTTNNPTQSVHHAMIKHGIDNFEFEIIASCTSQDDANETETELVKQYDSFISNGKGYNATLGGMNAPKTEAFKQAMRNYWSDPTYKEKVGQAISNSLIMRTPEEKEAAAKLLSVILRGRHLSSNTEFKSGHQHSSEVLQKISEAKRGKPSHMKGKKHTPETCQKISDSLKGKPSWNKGTKGLLKSTPGSFTTKTNYPDDHTLLIMVESKGLTGAAKQLGITASTLHHQLKKRGLK